MIDLGVRVEFYEQVIEGEPSKGYLGHVDRTEGYRAVAVPAVGERIMAASLRVTERKPWVPLPGPDQLVVRFVEHHLVPERDGKVPAWWDSYDEPGATVVVHISLGTSRGGELLQRMVRQFVADGWGCTGPEGSELWEYGLQAREELRR
ncbi:hypothetical protein OG416_39160 (plasmid) [Streptomyces longwoodensis]|uniref:hypothetical protein n=1 Tax=Streptomyces longwoodensis TaxID=68231 RepID=UPI00352EDA7A|nr:hypothetical protein OG416_39160 [Streptomyces longwoodensis]